MIHLVTHDVLIKKSTNERGVSQHVSWRFGVQRTVHSNKHFIKKALYLIVIALKFLLSYSVVKWFVSAMKTILSSQEIYQNSFSGYSFRKSFMEQMRKSERPAKMGLQSSFTYPQEIAGSRCKEHFFSSVSKISTMLRLRCICITDEEYLKISVQVAS